MKRKSFRPQDVLVLAKLLEYKGKEFKQKDLANEIGISQAEVVHSLNRLEYVGLYNKKENKLNRLEIIQFMENALKYLFPLEEKGISRGIGTGASSDFLKKKIRGGEGLDSVWAWSEGKEKGLAVEPLFETVPQVAANNEYFRKFLNIADILRGKFSKRVLEVASTELRKMVLGK